MQLNEYQEKALKTACYNKPEGMPYAYPLLALCEEVGELHGKVAKSIRGDKTLDSDAVKKELGDIAWQLVAIIHEFGFSFEEVCQANIEKLQDRAERNVLKGDGDNR